MANLVFNIVSGAFPVLVEIVELEYSLSYYEYGEHTIYGLEPGTYTLHCTDINGCEVTIENIVITEQITTTTSTTEESTTTTTITTPEPTTTTTTTTEEPTTTTTTTIEFVGCVEYGYLYNWYAVNDARNIANTGWHVPSKTEVDILISYLGSNSGLKMKETGTVHWADPNAGATNETGFNGRGAGYREVGSPAPCCGEFEYITISELFWTSTIYYSDLSWAYGLTYNSTNLGYSNPYNKFGLSMRLIKDDDVLDAYIGNDNKQYQTVKIGNQVWLAENLAETKYANNDNIPYVYENDVWIALTTGARCAYNNDCGYVGCNDACPTTTTTTTCDDCTTTTTTTCEDCTTTTTTCVGPIITDQPDDEELCEGETAVFDVATSASEPTYQWQIYTGEEPPNDWADLSDDESVSGAQTATLSVSGVNAGYSGSVLRCVVTANGCSTPSDSATLTVNELLQYRSAATGDWEDADTWEKFDGTDWYPSSTYPGEITNDCPDPSCTIRDGHTVSVYNYIDYDFDSVIVEEGGTLILYFLTTTTTTVP